MPQESTDRRRFLQLVGGTSALALAGCVNTPGGESDQGGQKASVTVTATPTPTEASGSSHDDGHDHASEDMNKYLPGSATVTMVTTEDDEFVFEDDVVQIRAGGTVTFKSKAGYHTASAYHPDTGKPLRIPHGAESFDTGMIGPDEEASVTFSKEGVYNYYCMPHEGNGMVGAVIVGDPDPADQAGLLTPQESLPSAAKSALDGIIQNVKIQLSLPILAEVSMKNVSDGQRFGPDIVRIRKGGSVKWVGDSGTHTATAYHPGNGKPNRVPVGTGDWNSGLIKEGGSFVQNFTTEGVYDYFCMPHESLGMVGTVIVGNPSKDGQPALDPPQEILTDPVIEHLSALNDTAETMLDEDPLTNGGAGGSAGGDSSSGNDGSGGDDGSSGSAAPKTVEVAAKSTSDGSFVFEPALAEVEPGDTVKWSFQGMHTVTAYSDANGKQQRIPDGASSFDSGMKGDGETFEHTFEDPGVYDYYCMPHEGMGMAGSVVVGSPDPSGQPGLSEPDSSVMAADTITELNTQANDALSASSGGDGGSGGSGGSSAPQTKDDHVANYSFDPGVIQITPGDTVEWTIDEGMHTITSYSPGNDKQQRIPDGAAEFDSGMISAGDTFSHTFETEGVYDYFCLPHEGMGMVGTVVVGSPTSGEPGLSEPDSTVMAADAISDLNAKVEQL